MTMSQSTAPVRLGKRGAGADRQARRGSVIAAQVFVIGVIVAGWQLIGDDSAAIRMPTFVGAVKAMAEEFTDGEVWRALATSNLSLVIGFILAFAVALPMGVAIGRFPWAVRAVNPFITVLIATPLIIIVPVIQAMFGLSLAARVTVVFLFAVGFLLKNIMVGSAEVDRRLMEMGASFCGSRWAVFRRIILPAAIPSIVAGSVLGLTHAVSGMIVAELTIIGAGIGTMIVNSAQTYQTAELLSLVILVVSEGVILAKLLNVGQRRLERWRGVDSDD